MFGTNGFEKSVDKAILCFESAAKTGDLQSPFNLFLLYQVLSPKSLHFIDCLILDLVYIEFKCPF
jgi:hypothetical protein